MRRYISKLPTQPVWYSLALSFLTFIVLTIAGILYTQSVQKESEARYAQLVHNSERQWCEIIVTLDDSYKLTPPTTDVGKRVAQGMARLRREFRCDER